MNIKYLVAWSTQDEGKGWGREYRTFETHSQAERFYDNLNARPDCYEGYLTAIEDNIS